MPADRAQAKQRVRKVPKPFPAPLWNIPARKLGKTLLRMASRWNERMASGWNGFKDQAFNSRKWQTAGSYGVHWWLQFDNRGVINHTWRLLDHLKRGQNTHAISPHRFSKLATKSEQWNGKPRLACVSIVSTCWAWDPTCWHKAKDITPSVAWRREGEKRKCLTTFLGKTKKDFHQWDKH